MTKEEKALKEVEAYQWMKSKGYDRRACKDVAPILVSYLSEELSKLHQPTVSGAVCKHQNTSINPTWQVGSSTKVCDDCGKEL